MSEIHFTEDQLKNPQALAAALFEEDASDPRSWNYQRQLVRPRIRWAKIIIAVLLYALGLWGIGSLLMMLSVPCGITWVACSAVALVILGIFLKRIIICIVKIYQRYAPATLRNKCRFEPSCSQYMILALQKYGLRKGLLMGIDRMKRCNTDGGGFDYP